MIYEEAVTIYETIRDTWRYSSERCQREQQRKLSSLLDSDLDDDELCARIDYLRQAIADHIDTVARMNADHSRHAW